MISQPLTPILVQVDADHNGTLDFDEFANFYQSLRFRKEISDLFKDLAESSYGFLSLESMKAFLETSQEEFFPSDEEVCSLFLSVGFDTHLSCFEWISITR